MRVRICWDIPGKYGDRTQDNVVIEADTVEEIQEMAQAEIKKRGVDEADAWSEEIT